MRSAHAHALQNPSGLREPEGETRALWLEVAAVLLIAVVPSLWTSLTNLVWPETLAKWPAVLDYLDLTLWSFQVGALVLYLIWRSGTPWARFGLVAPRGSDAFWLAAAMIAGYFAYAFYAAGVTAVISFETLRQETEEIARMFPPATEPGEILLLVLAQLANAFAEELAMRGYLIPRFERLLGSSLKAVLLSSVLFGSYHLYQGPYGAGSALVLGLVYGAIFCWSRRLWPVVAAHALRNLLPMLQG